jgi:hypothetical protein
MHVFLLAIQAAVWQIKASFGFQEFGPDAFVKGNDLSSTVFLEVTLVEQRLASGSIGCCVSYPKEAWREKNYQAR